MSSSAPPAKRPLTCGNGTIFIGYVVQVGIHMLSDLFALFRHPDLGVLICSDCLLKYNKDDWTNYPATGDFEQCRFLIFLFAICHFRLIN